MKRMIHMSEFISFIEKTKGEKYTFFEYNQNVYDTVFKMIQKKRQSKDLIIQDTKFKKMQYIKFLGFNDYYYRKVKEIIECSTYSQLILDLRDNPGGKFEVCLKIIDLMVPRTEILSVKRYKDSKKYYTDNNFKPFDKIYILLNDNTASCSEILCMVLKKKLLNVYIIGNKHEFKRYTQHVIYNKLYGYRFAIVDGIWSVDMEETNDLKQYLAFSDKKLEVLSDYLECINTLQYNC